MGSDWLTRIVLSEGSELIQNSTIRQNDLESENSAMQRAVAKKSEAASVS